MIIYKENPRRAEYMLSSLDENTTHVCLGKKSIVIHQPIDRLIESWDRWMRSEYIQIAFSYLNVDEREFLMTGITDEEWNLLFPPESEN